MTKEEGCVWESKVNLKFCRIYINIDQLCEYDSVRFESKAIFLGNCLEVMRHMT